MTETPSTILRSPNQSELVTRNGGSFLLPTIITAQGEKTTKRFLEFFAATIRNKNTRLAYFRAVCKFFSWCEVRRVQELSQVEPLLVATFIEEETGRHQAQTVKQELAAIRKLFRLPGDRPDYALQSGLVCTRPFLFSRGRQSAGAHARAGAQATGQHPCIRMKRREMDRYLKCF
jgi:hypothetical protein